MVPIRIVGLCGPRPRDLPPSNIRCIDSSTRIEHKRNINSAGALNAL